VGVPTPARVALRDDQHVFADRRQVAAAQRAAVRRGLEVLRATDRPPPLGLPGGHLPKNDIGPAMHAIFSAVEHRDERIVVETSRHRISGVLRLPRDGYRSRLTDYLNASERSFLPLTDVEIRPLEAESQAEHRPFLALSLQHIVLAMPSDPGQTDEGTDQRQG
jgi:hypothetical protein